MGESKDGWKMKMEREGPLNVETKNDTVGQRLWRVTQMIPWIESCISHILCAADITGREEWESFSHHTD